MMNNYYKMNIEKLVLKIANFYTSINKKMIIMMTVEKNFFLNSNYDLGFFNLFLIK